MRDTGIVRGLRGAARSAYVAGRAGIDLLRATLFQIIAPLVDDYAARDTCRREEAEVALGGTDGRLHRFTGRSYDADGNAVIREYVIVYSPTQEIIVRPVGPAKTVAQAQGHGREDGECGRSGSASVAGEVSPPCPVAKCNTTDSGASAQADAPPLLQDGKGGC